MPRANDNLAVWGTGSRKTFRLLPDQKPNDDLHAFLDGSDGESKHGVMSRMPYFANRVRGRQVAEPTEGDGEPGDDDAESDGGRPSERRYRDARSIFEMCGLLWEDDEERVRFTGLGHAVKRFLGFGHAKNVGLIARHAAFALNVAQLRNPTGSGLGYAPVMEVFPARFLWKAMLQLDHGIDSNELNRAIFRVQNAAMLEEAVERIRRYRTTGDEIALGQEVETSGAKNDRLIPPMSIASFGWTLISDKKKDHEAKYRIKPECVRLLEAAISVPVRHREYVSVEAYVTAMSNAACLPQDDR